MPLPDYLTINKTLWDQRTQEHLHSNFYDMPGFLAGENKLNAIELDLLGDVRGKTIIHLQCHFGIDTLCLARMGAKVIGVDLSSAAITQAKLLAAKANIDATFVEGNVLDAPDLIAQKADLIFASYGVIGWHPDAQKWADVAAKLLKPGGQIVFAEFHPAVWMFDDDFEKITYPYFNGAPIVEDLEGTYTDFDAPIKNSSITWNHGLAEVMQAFINAGFAIADFREFDYSPYPCFKTAVEVEKGKWQIKGLEGKLPLVYAISGQLTR
jgi:2-polyprenyl-3-methyl-5-hydroxy-6-metoxy-1,4-benzoquinol methylase